MEKSFYYQALDREGRKIKGAIKADTRLTVNSRVRAMGLIPLEIKEKGLSEIISKQFFLRQLHRIGLRQYSSRDLMKFCQQLSALLKAGISITRALITISTQMENRSFKIKLDSVTAEIEEGSDFATALRKQGSYFPPLLVNMIEAGETGGMLDKIAERMAVHYERQHDLEEKIRTATAYPIFISIVALLVVLIMIIFVLPQFSGIFASMGMDLPLFSRIMLSSGVFILDYCYYLVTVVVIIVSFMKLLLQTKKGRLYADMLHLSLPLIGKIYVSNTAARFARTLGTLIGGGVPIHSALKLADNAGNSPVHTNAVVELSEALSSGETIAATMAKSKCFPPLLTEMVRVGEETGTLDQTLEQAANYYEKEVAYIVERLGTMLEPLLLLAVGAFIGVLVFSILSPMYRVFEMI